MEKVIITREDLYQNVWTKPLTQVAKEYKNFRCWAEKKMSEE